MPRDYLPVPDHAIEVILEPHVVVSVGDFAGARIEIAAKEARHLPDREAPASQKRSDARDIRGLFRALERPELQSVLEGLRRKR